MRPRKRHQHFRRQTGVILQPGGGLLLDAGGQWVTPEDNMDGSQRPFSTGSGNQFSATHPLQTAHHAIPSSSGAGEGPTSSPFLTSQTSAVVVAPVAFSSSSASPFIQSTTHRSSSSSSRPFGSVSITAVASSSAVQSSAAASHTPTAGRPVAFYGGIAFAAVVAFACTFSFVAWLLRSRRKGSKRLGSSSEDQDVEGQDIGFGLGLYLDKQPDGFDSQKAPSSPSSDPTRSALRAGPPGAFASMQGFTNPPARHATTTRPTAAHLLTNDSVQIPNRLLGPLQVKNYVSGDFTSSCDEAIPSPKLGCAPHEPQVGGTPRFLGPEGYGLMPWAPLNVKSSPASNHANIAHSLSKKSDIAQVHGNEEALPLPMPPFDFMYPRRDCEIGNPGGWGPTLHSNIYNALSGVGGDAPELEEDISATLPGSFSRSDRWRSALSSHKSAAGANMVASESHSNVCKALLSSNPNYARSPAQFGHGTVTLDSIGLGLIGEQRFGEAASPVDSAAALAESQFRVSRTWSKRHPSRVKLRTTSRASSAYSPFPGTARRFTKSGQKGSKRRGAPLQPTLTTRTRPEFLRQPTAGSITSFSSEAWSPARGLTDEEFRAKRTMMLRARRKRGMGVGDSSGRRLTERLTHTTLSPATASSEPVLT